MINTYKNVRLKVAQSTAKSINNVWKNVWDIGIFLLKNYEDLLKSALYRK